MTRAAVRGVALAYSREGSGPVLIVAHGLMTSRAASARNGLLDLAPVVAAGFTTIRYDARGHGESTGTAVPSDYTWSALADDLLEFAEVVAPGETVAVMGTSMGTATALFAALRQPSRFSALVLAGPPTAWETRAGQARTYRAAAEIVETSGLAELQRLAAAVEPAPIFADLPRDPDIAPDVSAELLPAVLRGAAGSDLPAPDDLTRITQPTLVMPWATDPGHPVSTAEVIASAVPNATLEIAQTLDDVRQLGARAAQFLSAVANAG